MHRINSKQLQNPRGFTLIELLMVIAIIGIMLTMSLVVMFGITDQASEEATNSTIQKVNRLLELRIDSFNRAFPGNSAQWEAAFISHIAREVANREGVPQARVEALLKRFAEGSPVWQILAKKASYRFEFPQRMEEILAGAPFNNDSNTNAIPDTLELKLLRPTAEQQLRDGYDGIPPNPSPSVGDITTRMNALWAIHNGNRTTESSELLYFFLFHSGNFGSAEVSRDEFTEKEIADTDGDGLREFVDAWGQPLRFYRWPTRLIDPSLPLGAFAPNFATENDPTDLMTILSVDRARVDVGAREVDQLERNVAELLIKGLPRKLQFTNAYIAAACSSKTDRPGITDVDVIIPPDPLLRDPDDPAGLLYSLLESGIPTGSFTVDLSWEFNEQNYHTPDTFHAPLIVSPGLDGILGLYEPFDVGTASDIRRGNLAQYNPDPDGDGTRFFEHAAVADRQAELNLILDVLSDSLTNRNRRSGGRR
jgi:prepilin-type N-terminal cleavage/methylation domain-containing protein